ncbi:MAG: STAS domain-containing protein [Nitrospirota bacterium]
MTAALKVTNKKGILTLSGTMTVCDAENLKATLLKALKTADQIVLDCNKLEEVDLACIQVFCSAHRTALMQEKHLGFQNELPNAFGKSAEEVGFIRSIGCSFDREHTCLWKPVNMRGTLA